MNEQFEKRVPRTIVAPEQVVEMIVPALFDAHVHVRQESVLPAYVNRIARYADAAVIMPNTKPVMNSGPLIAAYRGTIQRAVRRDVEFTPLMTFYLTPETTYQDIEEAKKMLGKHLVGVKLYPRGATIGSEEGIPFVWLRHELREAPKSFHEALEAIASNDLVLNIHGEYTDAPLLLREQMFLASKFMETYLRKYPQARLVMEHISTENALNAVSALRPEGHKIAATVTLHHLCMTIDDTYGQVHNCCWPPPRHDSDRRQLQGAIKDDPIFFLGSDSAPHPPVDKYTPTAKCGCYTAPVLIEKLAEWFSYQPLADPAFHLTAFASQRGRDFYGNVAASSGRVLHLKRRPWAIPAQVDGVVPWQSGKVIEFALSEE